MRYAADRLGGSLTYFRQRLKDEIVDVFDPVNFLSSTVNADGKAPLLCVTQVFDVASGILSLPGELTPGN